VSALLGVAFGLLVGFVAGGALGLWLGFRAGLDEAEDAALRDRWDNGGSRL
jgi:hypothetical protein